MPERGHVDALVIGAGPAGLMAAEMLADSGLRVTIAEAKPSPARKFLMAGKSGLNLTHDAPLDDFVAQYADAPEFLRASLAAFDNSAVKDWARSLGQELFTGSTGRVFPKAMKASPLLRAWLERLAGKGVTLQRNWRWTGWRDGAFAFETPLGVQLVAPKVCVLALGGASWPRLGSDAAWVPWLREAGVEVTPFEASNAALNVHWTAHMQRHFGTPLKAVAFHAGGAVSRGEVALSAKGIEGGGIYPLARRIGQGQALKIDLLPDLDLAEVAKRLGRPQGKATLAEHLRKTLHLPPVKLALLQEFARPLPQGDALAALIKALPVAHDGLRPIAEAISSAGGIAADAMTDGLMLKALPGVFACGEMLDWDAPTGGYLLTGCFATGRIAGQAAADYAAAL